MPVRPFSKKIASLAPLLAIIENRCSIDLFIEAGRRKHIQLQLASKRERRWIEGSRDGSVSSTANDSTPHFQHISITIAIPIPLRVLRKQGGEWRGEREEGERGGREREAESDTSHWNWQNDFFSSPMLWGAIKYRPSGDRRGGEKKQKE